MLHVMHSLVWKALQVTSTAHKGEFVLPDINNKARKLDLLAGRLSKKLMCDPWCKMLPTSQAGVQIRLLLAANAALGCPSPTSAGPDLLLRVRYDWQPTCIAIRYNSVTVAVFIPDCLTAAFCASIAGALQSMSTRSLSCWHKAQADC